MNQNNGTSPTRRIYPLDHADLSQEQLAVVFAMTSRRPEAFDAIAAEVGVEKAAQFHERWVLNYGHASVAEHAVIHMAVEIYLDWPAIRWRTTDWLHTLRSLAGIKSWIVTRSLSLKDWPIQSIQRLTAAFAKSCLIHIQIWFRR